MREESKDVFNIIKDLPSTFSMPMPPVNQGSGIALNASLSSFCVNCVITFCAIGLEPDFKPSMYAVLTRFWNWLLSWRSSHVKDMKAPDTFNSTSRYDSKSYFLSIVRCCS